MLFFTKKNYNQIIISNIEARDHDFKISNPEDFTCSINSLFRVEVKIKLKCVKYFGIK